MKYTIYTGIDIENLHHGGEYPIQKNVEVCGKLFGRYILDNCNQPFYVSIGNCKDEFNH